MNPATAVATVQAKDKNPGEHITSLLMKYRKENNVPQINNEQYTAFRSRLEIISKVMNKSKHEK